MPVAKVPVIEVHTLSSAERERTTGVMVGTTDGRSEVSIARLVDGKVEWREDWDPDEAEAIGSELVRLARQRRASNALRDEMKRRGARARRRRERAS